jgi:hypothetical protein
MIALLKSAETRLEYESPDESKLEMATPAEAANCRIAAAPWSRCPQVARLLPAGCAQ